LIEIFFNLFITLQPIFNFFIINIFFFDFSLKNLFHKIKITKVFLRK